MPKPPPHPWRLAIPLLALAAAASCQRPAPKPAAQWLSELASMPSGFPEPSDAAQAQREQLQRARLQTELDDRLRDAALSSNDVQAASAGARQALAELLSSGEGPPTADRVRLIRWLVEVDNTPAAGIAVAALLRSPYESRLELAESLLRSPAESESERTWAVRLLGYQVPRAGLRPDHAQLLREQLTTDRHCGVRLAAARLLFRLNLLNPDALTHARALAQAHGCPLDNPAGWNDLAAETLSTPNPPR